MKTSEFVEHNRYGARSKVYNIDSIDNDARTISVSSPCYPDGVITFVEKDKFEQLMRCGYTFVVCWGDILEYIIKN